jgi:hypothetical protein
MTAIGRCCVACRSWWHQRCSCERHPPAPRQRRGAAWAIRQSGWKQGKTNRRSLKEANERSFGYPLLRSRRQTVPTRRLLGRRGLPSIQLVFDACIALLRQITRARSLYGMALRTRICSPMARAAGVTSLKVDHDDPYRLQRQRRPCQAWSCRQPRSAGRQLDRCPKIGRPRHTDWHLARSRLDALGKAPAASCELSLPRLAETLRDSPRANCGSWRAIWAWQHQAGRSRANAMRPPWRTPSSSYQPYSDCLARPSRRAIFSNKLRSSRAVAESEDRAEFDDPFFDLLLGQ